MTGDFCVPIGLLRRIQCGTSFTAQIMAVLLDCRRILRLGIPGLESARSILVIRTFSRF